MNNLWTKAAESLEITMYLISYLVIYRPRDDTRSLDFIPSITFQLLNYCVRLGIIDEGSVPKMRIRSI